MRGRLILALVVAWYSFAEAPAPQTQDVPARNGVALKTDVYLPETGGPAYPVILVRSPYPRETARGEGRETAKAGFACVIQSVRGTGGSGGVFTGFLDDGWTGNTDGADCVEWILKQPWCNGKIATTGGSAAANTQNLLAGATTKIACQFMEAGACDFYRDLAYPGGVWRPEQTDRWFAMFGEDGKSARALLQQHPTYDSFWEGYNVELKAPTITAPAIHVGGWFDIFKEGTIRSFMSRQYNGGPGAIGNQKLIMKWSGHGDYRKDMAFKFPENVFDLKVSKHKAEFFQHWLNDEPLPKDDAPVWYYVIGDDTSADAPGMEWRSATRWPPFPPREKIVYLYGDILTEAPPENVVSREYTYDPANPCPTLGGYNLTIPFGPYDQRELFTRKDVLLFTGGELDEPVEITGRVRLKLFVSSDAPDTDFSAKVLDIYPSGDERAILVMESIQRVKYRDGFEKPAAPLERDAVVPIEIDLGHISWIVNTGHKLAVLISSSNYPHFEVNPNTGEDFPAEGKTKPANNAVHMGPKRPCALYLPIRTPELDSDKDGATDESEWSNFTDLNNPASK